MKICLHISKNAEPWGGGQDVIGQESLEKEMDGGDEYGVLPEILIMWRFLQLYLPKVTFSLLWLKYLDGNNLLRKGLIFDNGLGGSQSRIWCPHQSSV